MKKLYTEPALELTRLTLMDVILTSGNITPTEYQTPIKRIRRAMEDELENNGDLVEDPIE